MPPATLAKRLLFAFASIAVVSAVGLAYLLVSAHYSSYHDFKAKHDRTRAILRCIVFAGIDEEFPSTIEEQIERATSEKYCHEPYCVHGARPFILGRQDAWGNALEFEIVEEGNSYAEIAVISPGADGRRGGGDDLVMQFYLKKAQKIDR